MLLQKTLPRGSQPAAQVASPEAGLHLSKFCYGRLVVAGPRTLARNQLCHISVERASHRKHPRPVVRIGARLASAAQLGCYIEIKSRTQ